MSLRRAEIFAATGAAWAWSAMKHALLVALLAVLDPVCAGAQADIPINVPENQPWTHTSFLRHVGECLKGSAADCAVFP
jgi:hypothetical protein